MVGSTVGPEGVGWRIGVKEGELGCLEDCVVAAGEKKRGVGREGECPGLEGVGCYVDCGDFAGGVPGLGIGCALTDGDGAVGEGHCDSVWFDWVPEQV